MFILGRDVFSFQVIKYASARKKLNATFNAF